jgi:hypothetical protein
MGADMGFRSLLSKGISPDGERGEQYRSPKRGERSILNRRGKDTEPGRFDFGTATVLLPFGDRRVLDALQHCP